MEGENFPKEKISTNKCGMNYRNGKSPLTSLTACHGLGLPGDATAAEQQPEEALNSCTISSVNPSPVLISEEGAVVTSLWRPCRHYPNLWSRSHHQERDDWETPRAFRYDPLKSTPNHPFSFSCPKCITSIESGGNIRQTQTEGHFTK